MVLSSVVGRIQCIQAHKAFRALQCLAHSVHLIHTRLSAVLSIFCAGLFTGDCKLPEGRVFVLFVYHCVLVQDSE